MQGNNILEYMEHAAPYIKQAMVDDMAVSLVEAENNTFLAYYPGESIDHGCAKGDPVPEKTGLYQAMKQGKHVVQHFDSEKFGFPYVSSAVPLKDENSNVVGSLAFTKSLERQNQVYEMANHLSEAVSKIMESAETISGESEELASTGNELSDQVQVLNTKVSETDEILNTVQGVTNQTNLLGLNAAIEATRLGEKGRGFMVVAEEIRKLADNSKESLKKIEEILSTLKENEQNVSTGVQNIENISNQQAHELQSITEEIKNIETMSNKLVEFAKNL
ncbi:methyl-accepting chemotaxis protein [Natranaerobius thermophilus]|uniref:Methyl-accepting chemotaxis sensory transducer n=1 Tax=Natranaerobius thermophilus (strain ATCC BAA-1301 / DSM 18059 / JW/NM-WN-LF) TaxID=457570 RepID=B2A2D3_NATTJ|nr:methyl-accepting chemotaxis protein [Natranaerobius thermophilus]ACB86239.1 methyl-accepting chemotaxis sensory transducer [Natranaerobius thermophilus JW/NM-WN-LF]